MWKILGPRHEEYSSPSPPQESAASHTGGAADFFQLEDRLGEVTDQFFRMTQAASDNKEREIQAIIKCQSFYRASKVRAYWHSVVDSTLLLKRCARGMLGRKRTKLMRLERVRKQNTIFFHHCASVIQKFFRGWWSRKHLHNYYGRKAYLEKVEKRGEWTMNHLRIDHANKLREAKENEEAQMRQEFNNLAGELHHLVSTKTIPGVYNPPYNDALPRAFEKPIEQHLRDSMQVRLPRALRRPSHPAVPHGSSSARSGCYGTTQQERIDALGPIKGPPQDLPDRNPHYSRTASAGRMQKVQGPFRSKEQIEVSNAKAANLFRSVQQSAPYDAMDRDRKMQQKLSKLTRISPIDFMAPGMPPCHPAPTSVHTAIPFRERQPELRNDYVELPKIRDKPPFFCALPKDGSFDSYGDNNLLPHCHV